MSETQTPPWRIWRTGTEHFTILDAHPYHRQVRSKGGLKNVGQPADEGWHEQAYEPTCPLCRAEKEEPAHA